MAQLAGISVRALCHCDEIGYEQVETGFTDYLASATRSEAGLSGKTD